MVSILSTSIYNQVFIYLFENKFWKMGEPYQAYDLNPLISFIHVVISKLALALFSTCKRQ